MADETPAVQVAEDGGAVQSEVQKGNGVDLSSPAVQEAIRAAAEAATKELKDRLSEFRDNNTQLQKRMKTWDSLGTDPEKIKSILENLSKNEETRLIAEGKIDEVYKMRVEPLTRDYETKLAARDERILELSETVKKSSLENFDLRVSNQVAAAAAANPDVNPDMIPLIVDQAKRVWNPEDNGEIVPRHPNGGRWIGKDGKTDIKFSEWIDGLKDHFPSMFKAPSGPGVRGGPGRITVDLSQMSPADRIEYARTHNIR